MLELSHQQLVERLREALVARGITQGELADRVGASQAAVSQWLSGRKRPSRSNIRSIAEALAISPEWLEYAVGGMPEDVDRLRDEYRSLTSWWFRPAPKDGGRDFGNANVWSFNPTIDSLGRETGQNIKDARKAATVRGRYRIISLKGKDLDSFLGALKWNELRPHLEASGGSRQKLAQFIRDGLAHLDRRRELLLLLIEDSGGVGLTGEEFGHDDVTGHFMALCRNNLDSEKDPKAAGAFGLGKAVLWRTSRLATVLFHSNLSEKTDDGRQFNRVFGRVELPWHRTDSDNAGPGWFGAIDKAHECAVSIWDNSALAKDLFMERDTDLPGTSILVVGFHDPAGEEDQPKVLARQLEEAIARNFWPAIVSQKLEVRVETSDGPRISSSTVVDPAVLQPHFVETLSRFRAGDLVAELGAPGDVAVRRVPLTVPRRIAPEDPHAEYRHEALVLVRYASEEDETTGQIVFFRGAEMIVLQDRWRGIRVGAKPFHAVVLCGEAAGSDAAAVAADRFLKTAEPPAHNAWTSTQELKVSYARGSKKALDEFVAAVRTSVGEAVAPDGKDLSDGPRALRELLRIGPQTDEPPDRPRVVCHSATVNAAQSWVVEASVRVKPNTIKDGAPVVVFRAETGGGQGVRWATLEAVRGCSVEGGRLSIAPGAREARFRGATDPASHPVPAKASTIIVDFRDVHPVEEIGS